MTKAGYLIVLILAGLPATAQQKEKLIRHSGNESVDSLAQLRQWITEGFQLAEKDTAKAFSFFFEGIKEAKKKNKIHEQALIHRAFGQLLRQQNLYHRSFSHYLWSKDAFYKTGNLYELAIAELELSKAQYYRGNYRFSLRHYTEVVKLAKENNFTDVDGQAYEILGLLYSVFHSFQQNRQKFIKALNAKYKLKDEKGILYISGILTTGYYQNRMFDSSLYYANICLEKAEQLNMPDYINLSRFNKAYSLVRLARWKDAENEIAAFTIMKIGKQEVERGVRYHVLLGNYYTAQKRYQQGQQHYDTALNQTRINVFPELLEFIYRNISETYFQLGNYKMAFDYSQKYNDIISTIYTGENMVSMGNIEAVLQSNLSKDAIQILNHENNIKQLQLLREAEISSNLQRQNMLKDSILQKEKLLSDALKRENEYQERTLEDEKKLGSSLSRLNNLQTGKLEDERNIRLILITGLSILVLLVTVIFFLYRKQHRKNAIIQKQSDELQTLMKEIHHRVKNNLQIISSLLDLQSLTIQDAQASEAVKESRNRVHSMALIHQNLYNEGNIKGIQIENYINHLAENLFQSYNIQPGKVKLKTDIEQIDLDVDTVIPIGLILNELLSNSLKYAFTNKEAGIILVKLKQLNGSLLLEVKDNGAGFPPPGSASQSTLFGMKMIKAFAQKLKAKLDVYNDNGACVVMQINRYKLAAP